MGRPRPVPASCSATRCSGGRCSNTLYLSFVQLVLFFPIPIALALLLNSVLSQRLRNFIQSVVYLPHFFSWVLAITIFQQMLGGAGVLNQFLRGHDIATWDVMTNPHTFALLVTSQAIWKEAGWGIIVFLAALAAINTEHVRGGRGGRRRAVAADVAHHAARACAG